MKLTSIVAVLVTAAACGRSAAPPSTDRPPDPPRVVALISAEASGPDAVTVPATVQARERATLVARVPGSVIALPFREGEEVPRGGIVARVADDALRAAAAAADAERTAAETDLSRVEILLARSAATAQEADHVRARAAAARAGLASAREALGYAVLRAPFAGRVSARPAHVGDVVMPGAPLVEIEGDGLEVAATVEAAMAARLRIGASLAVEVDGQAAPLAAVVRAVSEAGDPATHRVQVRADLPQAAGLRSGLFARLRVPAAAPEDPPRLTVPAGALVRRGGLTGVYVVREGRARLRWIAAGQSAGGAVEVRAGLDPGERVVREPAGLTDGSAVREE